MLVNSDYSRKDTLKGIVLPETLTENLAEFIGIHIGDGTMLIVNNGYMIGYSSNLTTDLEYTNHIKKLIKILFNADSRIEKYYEKNATYLRIYSKAICMFLNRKFGIPFGKKSKIIDIPRPIANDTILLQSCIRGIFDTDGGVIFQKFNGYSYPVVKITTSSEKLANTLIAGLKKFGFHPIVFKGKNGINEISVKRKGEFEKWFHIIGSSNPKNLYKYSMFKNGGVEGI